MFHQRNTYLKLLATIFYKHAFNSLIVITFNNKISRTNSKLKNRNKRGSKFRWKYDHAWTLHNIYTDLHPAHELKAGELNRICSDGETRFSCHLLPSKVHIKHYEQTETTSKMIKTHRTICFFPINLEFTNNIILVQLHVLYNWTTTNPE